MGSDPFVPSRHGFPFSNEFRVPPQAAASSRPDAAAYGLGAGMCMAALERWLAGAPPSPGVARPERGDALYAELLAAQLTVLGGATRERLLAWHALPADGSWAVGEWRWLAGLLDAGRPAVVLLLPAPDPYADAADSPALLALGTRRAGGAERVAVYDPRRPGTDDLELEIRPRSGSLEIRYAGSTWAGLLVARAAPEPPFRPLRARRLTAEEEPPERVIRGSGTAFVDRAGCVGLVGANPAGEAVLYRREGERWSFENLARAATGSGGERLHGRPAVVPHGRGMTVVGRGPLGDLVEYRRSGLGRWRVRALADLPDVGREWAFETDPVAVDGPGGLRVLGSAGGRLLELRRRRRRWAPRDLGEIVPAAAGALASPAVALDDDGTIHVFCRAGDRGLVHLAARPGRDWRAELLPAVQGAAPVGRPVPLVDTRAVRLGVLARSDAGGLLFFRRGSRGQWRGGETGVRAPRGVREPLAGEPVAVDGPGDTLHVFAPARDGALLHLWWGRGRGWRGENLTDGRAAVPGSARVAGRVAAVAGPGAELRVFGRGEDGLIAYRWTPEHEWRASTGREHGAGGIPLRQDPAVAVAPDHRLHVFCTDQQGLPVELEAGPAAPPGPVGRAWRGAARTPAALARRARWALGAALAGVGAGDESDGDEPDAVDEEEGAKAVVVVEPRLDEAAEPPVRARTRERAAGEAPLPGAAERPDPAPPEPEPRPQDDQREAVRRAVARTMTGRHGSDEPHR